MGEWLGRHQGLFALVAALVTTTLVAYLLLRSPRNPFTLLVTAIVAGMAEWNIFEWLDDGRHAWPMNVQFVGISFLPALYLHFALSATRAGRHRLPALVAAYAAGATFASLALGALLIPGLAAYFSNDGDYNLHFVVVQGPLILAALALLGAGAVTGPGETRGVLLWMSAGGLPLAILGPLDLVTEIEGFDRAPGWGNLGAAITSVAFAVTALRHRDLFDSLAILQRETAGLLARTRHGVVSFDARGNAVFASDLAGRLLGELPRTLADLDAALPGLRERGGERFLRRGDRVLRATFVAGSPRVIGEARRNLLVEDCTEEARLLGEMAQRESLAALGEASAGMAHEIRNALTAVGTTLGTLSRETDPDPTALQGLDAEVRRIQDSLTRCLSLSRGVSPDRQDVDLDRLLRRVAESVPGGGGVRFETAGPVPAVYADPDLLGQVFHNLLRNALEAGAREVRVGTRREAEAAVVTVRSEGTSMPEAVAARLFEPFVTGKAGGTGLGLAICRKIVAAHGGRISGRNVGGGVEFEVVLPWTS